MTAECTTTVDRQCTGNTCTCPNGTPTRSSGSGATLCESNQDDCSACDPGFYISAIASTGSQTCSACKTSCPVGHFMDGQCDGSGVEDTITCSKCQTCLKQNEGVPCEGTSNSDTVVCETNNGDASATSSPDIASPSATLTHGDNNGNDVINKNNNKNDDDYVGNIGQIIVGVVIGIIVLIVIIGAVVVYQKKNQEEQNRCTQQTTEIVHVENPLEAGIKVDEVEPLPVILTLYETLKKLNLTAWIDQFILLGVHTTEMLAHVEEKDLVEIGMHTFQRRKLMKKINTLNGTDNNDSENENVTTEQEETIDSQSQRKNWRRRFSATSNSGFFENINTGATQSSAPSSFGGVDEVVEIFIKSSEEVVEDNLNNNNLLSILEKNRLSEYELKIVDDFQGDVTQVTKQWMDMNGLTYIQQNRMNKLIRKQQLILRKQEKKSARERLKTVRNKMKPIKNDRQIAKYQELLILEKDADFVDKKGRMVHFVDSDSIPMLSNTCKLTQKNGTALYAGSGVLTMRNKSNMNMKDMKINSDDYAGFMKSRKQKKPGPYFLRMSKEHKKINEIKASGLKAAVQQLSSSGTSDVYNTNTTTTVSSSIKMRPKAKRTPPAIKKRTKAPPPAPSAAIKRRIKAHAPHI